MAVWTYVKWPFGRMSSVLYQQAQTAKAQAHFVFCPRRGHSVSSSQAQHQMTSTITAMAPSRQPMVIPAISLAESLAARNIDTNVNGLIFV